ncbi:MAG TPA: MerR family transcriptional regulator [Thermodesulfobacteriota bacterium]|nr:MerR family transcriptional regulator [Thermodesulfobacteriota bacterium]
MKNEVPQKLYYKIGEVCDITGVPSHVLRFWEKQFPQLSPNKTQSGHRLYRRRDIEAVLQIKELLYERKFTIRGARDFLSLARKVRGEALQQREPGEVLGRLREGLSRLNSLLSRPSPFDR